MAERALHRPEPWCVCLSVSHRDSVSGPEPGDSSWGATDGKVLLFQKRPVDVSMAKCTLADGIFLGLLTACSNLVSCSVSGRSGRESCCPNL